MSVCIYLYLHFWLAFFLSLYKIASLSLRLSVCLCGFCICLSGCLLSHVCWSICLNSFLQACNVAGMQEEGGGAHRVNREKRMRALQWRK